VYRIDETYCKNLDFALRTEWMLANGIGGFAMGTVSGINSRRYHGHLIAATRPPTDRTLVLAGIEAEVTSFSGSFPISSNQYSGTIHPDGFQFLESFESSESLVVWRYRAGKSIVEKRISLVAGKNACQTEYLNIGANPIKISLRPLICVRSYHGNFSESASFPQSIMFELGETTIEHDGVSLWIGHRGAERSPVQGWYYRFEHAQEVCRGLDPRDDLYCPCELEFTLDPKERACLMASTDGTVEGWESKHFTIAKENLEATLESAAEKFLVTTESRTTILAGYPWFTDWGRDTMISLPGICLVRGKHTGAREILRSYASQMRRGLIPNRFVEEGDDPEYNTADGTLWFVNAVYKTLKAKWNKKFAEEMADVLDEIFRWHTQGTDFGICMDETDGLLFQGAEGFQLTWMDAKIGDWVVTPRHGKPVEISALWVNALRIMEWLSLKLKRSATRFSDVAKLAEGSFQERYWCKSRFCYFDTIDPEDASLRPNQLIAMALPFSPATGDHAVRALATIEAELLTPYGLRTLGPKEPAYRARFEGRLQELDAAYHQGTVWPWLLGSYITAVIKLTGDADRARLALQKVPEMLREFGIGGIAEVYDGDEPHRANGCPWQAWSVAEILRAIREDLKA
jgi:predicted glycogen debranching enzyme